MAIRTLLALIGMLGCVITFTVVVQADDESPTRRRKQKSSLQIEDLRFRFTFFDQYGDGYQSKDGPPGAPGSERLLVFQPMGVVQIRQNPTTTHRITVPVDIVSSASTDALDAVSSASRVNESGGFDVTTTWNATPTDGWNFRYGFNAEEPFGSVFAGVGYVKSLAEDNASLSINGNGNVDIFTRFEPDGQRLGKTHRETLNLNAFFSQILSRTTLGSVSYGCTFQSGTLETPWNSIAVRDTDSRVREIFPTRRVRHAWTATVLQHIPLTHSTLRARYRYYLDDFDLHAHTLELAAYQYITRSFYIRGSYRYHKQNHVDFFSTAVDPGITDNIPRTGDSDLAAFTAHEFGVKLLYFFRPLGSPFGGPQSIYLSFTRYVRSNDLEMNVFSTGYANQF